MDSSPEIESSGPFEARYLAFLETIAQLRPRLHRYCSRMTGSVLDGEDVVQDALFEAYRKLDQYDGSRPLGPWLFRIAHNRCIDLLRRRSVRLEAEMHAATDDLVMPAEPQVLGVGRAVEQLVINLPPRERACVLLKDVFDYTLDEIADLIDSNVGSVKAALNRGRSKLASLSAGPKLSRPVNPQLSRVLQLYVDGFNQRDWDGLRRLIRDDTRIRVADRFTGLIDESPYFGNYERISTPWRFTLAQVDSEWVAVALRQNGDGWAPHSVVRLETVEDRITRIVDYVHCPWVLPAASSVVLAGNG
jgi:RNA polymerase sigma-70 factor (ECF subfamily)